MQSYTTHSQGVNPANNAPGAVQAPQAVARTHVPTAQPDIGLPRGSPSVRIPYPVALTALLLLYIPLMAVCLCVALPILAVLYAREFIAKLHQGNAL